MIYIKFVLPKSPGFESSKKKEKNRLFVRLLSVFFPLANPDFEDILNNVQIWILEFENEDTPPCREIGLDNGGKVIVKMPLRDNVGYWCDNNLVLSDFKSRFIVDDVDQQDFEDLWGGLS